MDDLDLRAEAMEPVETASDMPQARPELRLVPPPLPLPPPDEKVLFIKREDILRTVLEKADFGVPLTEQARDFLYRAILPALGKIPADATDEAAGSNARELANFAFQVFSAANILGVPAEKRISKALRRMIFDNLLLSETLDRHRGRWPNTHGRARLLTLAKEIERTRKRLGEAADLSEELERMDASESPGRLKAKLQAGARMLEWLDRAEAFQQDEVRAEAQFERMMKNDSADVDCISDQPEKTLVFFAPLFKRQAQEPVDVDFITATFKERDWHGLKYPDPKPSQPVHPLLAVHEIAWRSCREKFGKDKQHALRQDLLRMVFDERRPLLVLFERIEERQLPFGLYNELKTFQVAVERRFDSWQPA